MRRIMRPNIKSHRPDVDYLRDLLRAIGMTQEDCARAIGIAPRALRYYLSRGEDHVDAPYLVQYALEQLAGLGESETQRTARDARSLLAAIIIDHGGELRVSRKALRYQVCPEDSLWCMTEEQSGDVVYRLERRPPQPSISSTDHSSVATD
jgi:hypothetical protein